MTIVGTRPEIIKLSRIIDCLSNSVEHILVHTGQNDDFELNQIFFDELAMLDSERNWGGGGERTCAGFKARFGEGGVGGFGAKFGEVLVVSERNLGESCNGLALMDWFFF
jgi:hypothetical protein